MIMNTFDGFLLDTYVLSTKIQHKLEMMLENLQKILILNVKKV